MNMRLWWRDVDIVERCGEMEFILYRRKGDTLVEEARNFKYLERTPEQTDDYWMSVQMNVKRAQMVWVRLGNMI